MHNLMGEYQQYQDVEAYDDETYPPPPRGLGLTPEPCVTHCVSCIRRMYLFIDLSDSRVEIMSLGAGCRKRPYTV